MRSFIVAIALIGSCLAVPQTFEKSLDYEIPSGKVSYSSHVPVDGVYAHQFGGVVQPSFRYGQSAVKSVYGGYAQPAVKSIYGGFVQPAFKSAVPHPVHDIHSYGQYQPIHDKIYDQSVYGKGVYGGYVQPSVRYNVPSKVVKPAVPFVQPVAPVVHNKFAFAPKVAQPITPVVQHVSPVFQHASPVAYPATYDYPAVHHGYVHPAEKVVKPFAKFGQVATPVAQPFAKFSHVASPVARIGHVAPAVTPYAQPIAKFGHVAAPAYHHHHDIVAKTAEAPAAIISQSHDSSVDGSFVSNFHTENGIQSTVHGSVKPVVGSDEPAQVMSGSYSYTSPDGTPVVTQWYADENGFHADGDHIPAIPEEIQKSLEYLSTIPQTHEEIKYRHY